MNQINKDSLIAFMFHDTSYEPEDIITLQDVKEMLNEYDVGHYIIALETEPYRHFHICCEMTVKNYNAFVKKHLKDRLKLRGRACNGQPRQYGRVLGIKKPDKMLAYTLKHGIYASNITEEELEPYKQMSYVRDTGDNDREIRDKMKDYLDKTYYKDHYTFVFDEQLKKAIIHFLLKEKIRIRTSSQIDGYFKYMRQFSNHDFIRKDCELYFYDLLYHS